jgi:hypothetical protein
MFDGWDAYGDERDSSLKSLTHKDLHIDAKRGDFLSSSNVL